jgi:hypothetical protein
MSLDKSAIPLLKRHNMLCNPHWKNMQYAEEKRDGDRRVGRIA